ncbi:carbohydrate ABC transporter permease [Paenibacillus mendelii]|uniref:Carbohydrate ABC transporter permease n=1 Tax=Paenibacillus mendelii TaxID=206163 RepID=A0ABV6JKU9_9BACL|nr:carbohydrate ABC transporter permease [Paenibacillus mendelii]MCQ6559065.1 carbohydrate ABC transporter permease [Paenibacillus mendelii]
MSTKLDLVKSKWTLKRGLGRKLGMKNKVRKVRYALLGREINNGLVFKLFLYAIFLSTSYIYIQPVLKMVVKMLMNGKDIIDPTVTWIPSTLYMGHLSAAWEVLKYEKSVIISIIVALLVAVFHCISCGFAGYAFARLEFPFKRIAFVLLLVAFIIPPQVVVLPSILAYRWAGLDNSLVSLVIPALFGFGVKGSLFVIIYRQFFMTQPRELEEAAKIDGASAIKFYLKVMFPLAKPAIIVVFLFSFVWTWNDTYMPRMFLGGAEDVPLAVQMSRLGQSLDNLMKASEMPAYLAEPIKMAASFLTILPPLLLYLFAQRYFVESVERTGLVE